VLATQAIIQRRPKTMRVMFEGRLPFGVTAKDLILALIGHIGAAGGTRYAWNMPAAPFATSGRRAAYHLQSFDRARRQDGSDRAG